jgi:hypothetical protein
MVQQGQPGGWAGLRRVTSFSLRPELTQKLVTPRTHGLPHTGQASGSSARLAGRSSSTVTPQA